MVESICKNCTKTALQSKSLACFLAKRDAALAAALQRKSSGGIIHVITAKIVTNENVSRTYLVIISARMVLRCCRSGFPVQKSKTEQTRNSFWRGAENLLEGASLGTFSSHHLFCTPPPKLFFPEDFGADHPFRITQNKSQGITFTITAPPPQSEILRVRELQLNTVAPCNRSQELQIQKSLKTVTSLNKEARLLTFHSS